MHLHCGIHLFALSKFIKVIVMVIMNDIVFTKLSINFKTHFVLADDIITTDKIDYFTS